MERALTRILRELNLSSDPVTDLPCVSSVSLLMTLEQETMLIFLKLSPRIITKEFLMTMQILRSYSRPTESELLGMRPEVLHFLSRHL